MANDPKYSLSRNFLRAGLMAIMAKCICNAVNAIVSYSFAGDLNPTRGQCKFLQMDVNDSFQD